MSRDYRDLTIETLAYELLAAEQSRDAYRELLLLTLGQLHDATKELQQQREQYARLVGQYRALRVQAMGRAA